MPAGLVDQNVELFVINDKIHALCKGTVIPFEDLPESVKNYFLQDMLTDFPAMIAIKKMGIIETKEMLQQYLKCNYGGFDKVPDLVVRDKSDANKEYWDCGCKGNCNYEGLICKLPSGPKGQLTKREMQVVNCLQQGKAIKEIAETLGTSFNTVRNQLANVKHKLDVQKDNEIILTLSV